MTTTDHDFPDPASTAGQRDATLTIEALEQSRLAALNMMEDAVEAQRRLKQANESLARAVASNDRLATAIEQSQDAVIITDAHAKIQYVNKTFERVTGYTRDEVIGQNPRVLKSGKHEPAFYRDMWSQLKNGNPVIVQFINKRKNGQLYTEDASLSPVMDATGKIVNYVGVKRDITERLKLEEQLAQAQKMETVGRLAGGVAHDFNNMLGVILGNSELLLSKLTPDNPLCEEVEAIVSAAKRSSDITRQLLTFARKQIIKPRILDVNEAVENCLKLLRRLIGENIELVWKPHASVCQVKMDSVQIDQILTNLCVNARDAIPNTGTVSITTEAVTISAKDCKFHEACKPGKFIVLSVTDTGAGMTPDVLDHIFEPFYTKKTLSDGTGLGLATVHGIVSQNGGFIDAQSQPGSGTTFRIHLPEQTETKAETETEIPVETPMGKGETVLIVEDEAMLLKLAATQLTSLGYHVLTALTPTIAIEQAKAYKGTIDLLLSDVIMSSMNGKELSTHIRTIYPEISIIFMSGYTADVIAAHGVLEKGVYFIPKPFSRNAIAVQLRHCLNGQ